jgi:uncharacterized protein
VLTSLAPMRKLDPATYRTMPWKNGGGTTTEALTVPDGASLDDFEIRISMARVAADGPFSSFVGVDRTLVVTEGNGVTLEMSDGAAVTLDATSAPFSFTGGDPVVAKLVMTRRSVLRHRAGKLTLDGGEARTFACAGELALLVVLEGSVVAGGGKPVSLERGEVLMLSAGHAAVRVEPAGARADATPPTLLLVDFFRR